MHIVSVILLKNTSLLSGKHRTQRTQASQAVGAHCVSSRRTEWHREWHCCYWGWHTWWLDACPSPASGTLSLLGLCFVIPSALSVCITMWIQCTRVCGNIIPLIAFQCRLIRCYKSRIQWQFNYMQYEEKKMHKTQIHTTLGVGQRENQMDRNLKREWVCL